MTNLNRAKQFLPFDALKGFYKEIRSVTDLGDEKIELEEDGLNRLIFKLNQIKKNMMIKVIYYNVDRYEIVEGLVSRIDIQQGLIMVVKNKLYINNIYDIYSDEIVLEEFNEI